MDRKFLRYTTEEIEKRFDELYMQPENDESYKFTAINTFRREWDVDAEDFLAMFQRATVDALPLLQEKKCAVNEGLVKVMEDGKVAEVRALFKLLFSEDGDDYGLRKGRVADFIARAGQLLLDCGLKGNAYKVTMQTGMTYLTLWRPEENFFLRSKEAKDFCTALGFSPDVGSGSHVDIGKYYSMCEQCLQTIRTYPKLMEMNKARALAVGFEDEVVAERVLLFDIYHAACTSIFTQQMGLDLSKAERTKATKKEYMELRARTDCKAELAAAKSEELLDWQMIVGKEVNSSRYGAGTIKALNGTTLEVAFADQVKYFDFKACMRANVLGLDEETFAAYSRDLQIREKTEDLKRKMDRLTNKEE